MSNAAGLAGTALPETGKRVRNRLVSGWHFTRHPLEMVVTMLSGMALLRVAIGVLGKPPAVTKLVKLESFSEVRRC